LIIFVKKEYLLEYTLSTGYINRNVLLKESDLWLDFRKGNKDAFSQLYRQCYENLYSYGISCGMNSHEADDAIQDLFLRIYSNPSLIVTPSTIRPFLFRSVKNYLFNLQKKKGKHLVLNDTELPFTFSYSLDESIIKEEEQVIVKKKVDYLLSVLSPRQREIIYLRFLHEMDYEEIASVMNISNQVARNLLYKAMEKLRSIGADNIPLIFMCLSLIKQF